MLTRILFPFCRFSLTAKRFGLPFICDQLVRADLEFFTRQETLPSRFFECLASRHSRIRIAQHTGYGNTHIESLYKVIGVIGPQLTQLRLDTKDPLCALPFWNLSRHLIERIDISNAFGATQVDMIAFVAAPGLPQLRHLAVEAHFFEERVPDFSFCPLLENLLVHVRGGTSERTANNVTAGAASLKGRLKKFVFLWPAYEGKPPMKYLDALGIMNTMGGALHIEGADWAEVNGKALERFGISLNSILGPGESSLWAEIICSSKFDLELSSLWQLQQLCHDSGVQVNDWCRVLRAFAHLSRSKQTSDENIKFLHNQLIRLQKDPILMAHHRPKFFGILCQLWSGMDLAGREGKKPQPSCQRRLRSVFDLIVSLADPSDPGYREAIVGCGGRRLGNLLEAANLGTL